MASVDQVVNYWLDEVGADGWYSGGVDLDEEIY